MARIRGQPRPKSEPRPSGSGFLSRARLHLAISVLAFGAGCATAPPPADRGVTGAWQRETRATGEPDDAAAEPRASVDDVRPRPAAATRPVRVDAVAWVNDEPIDRRELVAALLRDFGLNALQQRMLLAAARQAARAAGIDISEADIDAEYDLTIRAAHQDGDDDAAPPTSARRAQLIEMWLRRTGVSAAELRTAMTRQAYLRKLAAGRVTIDDDALRAEFERQCGEKVEVRHIQLASPREFERLRPRLERGEDFAALAARFSQNALTAREGGLLPAFSRNDERFPSTLREAAFRLQPGQFSHPVHYDAEYHVLRCERRLPPSTRTFDEVRAKLERDLRARRTAAEMDRLSTALLSAARVWIEDPVLRETYQRERAAERIVGPPLTRP